MDLQKIISELVSKLTGNKDLISKFTSDPAKIIKNLLGIDLNAADLAKVVKAVTEKLGTGAAAAGILGKIKSLFSK